MTEYLIIVIGFVLTLVKDIFKTEKEEKNKNLKPLNIAGRIAIVLGTLVFVLGLLNLYQANEKKKIESEKLRHKNQLDSIRYVEAKIRDSLILLNQLSENIHTQSLLEMSKNLNIEFQSKIKLQNQLLKIQENEIRKSRYKIEDEFYVNFEIWFNFQIYQNRIIEEMNKNPEKASLYTIYSKGMKNNSTRTDIHNFIFDRLAEFFDQTLFFLGFKKKDENHFSFMTNFDLINTEFKFDQKSKINSQTEHLNTFFEFNQYGNYFKLHVQRLPISIFMHDEKFVTLYDIIDSKLGFGFNNSLTSNLVFMELDSFFDEHGKCKKEMTYTIPYFKLINGKQPVLLLRNFVRDEKYITPQNIYYLFDKSLNN